MSKTKYILSYFTSLLLSICILLFVLLCIMKVTIFNSDFILNIFDEEKYYETLTKEIDYEISKYTLQSGLDEVVFENIIDKKIVEQNMKNVVKSFYENKKISIDTTNFKNSLSTNIETFLNNHNIVIHDKSTLDEYIGDLSEIYTKEFTFSGSLVKVQNIFNKLIKLVDIALIVLLTVSIIILIINITIFKKKTLAIPSFMTGIMLIFIYYFIINSIDINNITIYSDTVSKLISTYIFKILNILPLIGIISIVIGIIGSIIDNILESNKSVNHSKINKKNTKTMAKLNSL